MNSAPRRQQNTQEAPVGTPRMRGSGMRAKGGAARRAPALVRANASAGAEASKCGREGRSGGGVWRLCCAQARQARCAHAFEAAQQARSVYAQKRARAEAARAAAAAWQRSSVCALPPPAERRAQQFAAVGSRATKVLRKGRSSNMFVAQPHHLVRPSPSPSPPANHSHRCCSRYYVLLKAGSARRMCFRVRRRNSSMPGREGSAARAVICFKGEGAAPVV